MSQPLQAYIDDSTEGDTVLILAGYVANATQWDAFSREWKALLDEKPSRRVFKMRNVNLNRPTERTKAELHYRIIEKYIPFGFCVAMPHKPYKAVCEELQIQKRYRRPFYMAWLLLISSFRMLYTKYNWKHRIELLFDEQIGATDVNEAWDLLVQKQNSDMAPFKGRPRFVRDDDFLPIQAADLLAWWARKNWVGHGTFGNQKWLFPWCEGQPSPEYMYFEMSEDGIKRHILDNVSR